MHFWQLSASGASSGGARRRLSLPYGFKQLDDDEVVNPTSIRTMYPLLIPI